MSYAYNTQVNGGLEYPSIINEITAALGRVTDVGLYPLQMPTHVIYKLGSTFICKSGSTGAILNSGADAATLINAYMADDRYIYLVAGSYDVTAVINMNGYDRVRLGGAGNATKLYTDDNHELITANETNDCLIEGMWLYGDSDVAKTSQTGITAHTAVNLTIQNMKIDNMGYDGINLLYACNGCRIINNHILNCDDDGINPGGGGAPHTMDTIVANNYLKGMTSDGIHISADSERTVAIGNTIVSCGNGIGIYDSSNNIIVGNYIKTSGNGGITTESGTCANLTVTDNTVDGTTAGYGVNLTHGITNLIFKGNRVLNAFQYGVYIQGSKVIASDNYVSGSSEYGLVLSGGATFSQAVVNGNIVDTITNNDGININMEHVIVSNNRVSGCGRDAIREGADGNHSLFIGNSVDDAITVTGAGSFAHCNMVAEAYVA